MSALNSLIDITLECCKVGPRLLLITNRKLHTRFRLVPKSTTLDDPELALNGYYVLCYITHMSFGAHHKIWIKIDPYYHRQKCSPWIAVSSKIRFIRISTGVSWRGGFKWECGRWKWRFSLILLAISSEPSHLRPQLLFYTSHIVALQWHRNRWPWMTILR